MGKLLALELFNFKSYKGHHVLQFGDSYFTSIIGPNGSGKSNSMDAISFVLGIKSSHLRSTHLKDLVYRGRVLKHSKINADGDATDGVTNGEANGDAEGGASDEEEGDTQRSTQRNDPSTAWVMAVYEDDAGEEQRWKRSITSSGASEYRINNRVVNAKQYNESLEAENILIKARNFLVFQGDVENIANQKPNENTRLIEQISGSLEYKEEYERLKREKEKADQEQEYRLKQRRGINGEIKQFQDQKEELDKFESMREEKDLATVTHILWKLFHFQRTIEESNAEIQKHQEELKEYKRNVKKYEDRLTGAQQAHAEVGREVSRFERDIKRKEKAVHEKENALVPIDEKLTISNKNLASHQKRIAEITKERDGQKQSADQLQSNLTKVQKMQKQWENEFKAQQQQAGRELSDTDLQEYQRLRGEVYKRSGNDQIKADTIKRQLGTDEETVNSLKSTLDTTQAQVGTFENEVNGLKERRAEVNNTIGSTSREIDAKKKAVNTMASERERTKQKDNELHEKLNEVLRKLVDAQSAQRETRKEANQRDTVAQMKRLFSGVKGMLHQLCKPKQKKYETAISTALGRHWDSVVVDSEKTAKDCIQYLKEQRTGQMTFIPLDTIIHKQPNANLRGMQQGVRLAIDTIDYDASLERAMIYACGNAIVTDTLKIAREICYGRKVDAKAVTLDGTVIHKGGNMTGGEGPTDRKRRFEEVEVENMRDLAQKFRNDIEALPKGHKRQAEEEQLQSELTGLETKLKYAQDELKALDRNIESKGKELQFARGQLADIQPKHEEQSAGVESLREQLDEIKSSIDEVEDEVFGAFCQRLGYASIRDYKKQHGSMQEEANRKRVDFTTQISRLQNALNFETQRLGSTNARLTKNEGDKTRDESMIAQLEAEREELASELDEINAEIEQLHEQLTTVRASYNERGEKVGEARREVQKRQKSVEGTLKAISDAESEAQSASTKRYTTLRQCKVENTELPLERGSRKIDALPLEDAILEQDEDAMEVDGEEQTGQINDYGIRIDFSTLDDDLKEDESDECEAGLIEKSSNISAELEKMAPNMRSAERLDATHDRLKATEREFNDSRKAARDATKAFEKVKQKRFDLFHRAYSHIGEQIGPVYRELTKTTSFPLGGTASMTLEDDDEPYLAGIKYHAMPPLKRFRDMEHLSGGEKTMAALALLFAVHTYAPSPFFVLDEVDAALDNANTAQLASYVREHAGPGMQFVVISLKTGLFQNSETLVGVMRDQGVNSSRALTLDLRRYQAVA
ncbi:Structural maintenance of chromosomes protein 1B [Vermiconidia calcicola]|uniref:Structural maintenance of chromosomes protein 1B n=1 Tax=Vermiconidia calcicola TaxID=1690605 RepID=A0ACC3NMS5_9PEZI|nr:Structural maintenance of chromosomes protein 1B [Vermiconidia calcicola]